MKYEIENFLNSSIKKLVKALSLLKMTPESELPYTNQ